ncbi:MAG: S28 family serine protease [Acidobacteriota bacterium]
MIPVACRYLVLLLLAVAPVTLSAQTWIPVAAHTPGLQGSVWRTDVTILNSCAVDAAVELVLHTADGDVSSIFEIAAGRQQLFEDVVNHLVDGDLNGALEIRSDIDVSAFSRTYNVAGEGTFGQGLDSLSMDDGLVAGERVSLQQLRQSEHFRSNIGVLNMGAERARVAITLFDRLGSEVGTFSLSVDPGRTRQDTEPLRRRFGREDIVAGWAMVNVESGAGVWPYASVIDGRTGDPTTIVCKPMVQCPMDIAERLAAVDGLTVMEQGTGRPGYRFFRLYFRQAVDHDNPDGPVFQQYLTLLHRSETAPMVFETLGYTNGLEDRRTELTGLLEANQLAVEHRFFGQSDPGVTHIEKLTIEQAAADHHAIAEMMRAIYTGPWISSGASKGGMTAIFHRRFYPDDVDATVPYVAPISFGAPDDRYVTFLENVGTEQCRSDLVALQREALIRRQPMLDRIIDFAEQYDLSYDRIGGPEVALESSVVELPFTFWQYSGETYCSTIPVVSATDDAIFGFLETVTPIWWTSDSVISRYDSYYYQAQHQLGFPDLGTTNIADLLQTDWVSLEKGLVPPGVTPPTWDPAPMIDIADWVDTEGSELLFIYGENDTWTAGAFDLGNATDSSLYVVDGGTHGAAIADLSDADRAEVYETLERWTGVAPSKAAGVSEDEIPRGRWVVVGR